MDAEGKGQTSYVLVPFARHLYSCNQHPRSGDNTEGFFRRWVVAEFVQSFRARADMIDGDVLARPFETLLASLTTDAELSGLLNLALERLQGIRSHGFPVSASMRAAYERFRGETDHLALWLSGERG